MPLRGGRLVASRRRRFVWRPDDALNLLPYRALRLAALRRKRWLELTRAAGAGLAAVAAVISVQRVHQTRNHALAAAYATQLRALAPALQESSRLSGILSAARRRKEALAQLALARDDLFYLLNALQAGAGHGVALDQVDLHGGHATLKGRAADQAELAAWAGALMQAVGVDTVAMTDIRAVSGVAASSTVAAAPVLDYSARIDLNRAAPRSWPDLLGTAQGRHPTRKRARSAAAGSHR